MLLIPRTRYSTCDRLPRRNFLQIGALTIGGLSLPRLLKAESLGKPKNGHKAVIMVYLPGGPSHIDTFDPKPDAPVDLRGEFQTIGTTLPGIRFCEHLPLMAANLDKFTVIRSIVGCVNDHASNMCLTGFPRLSPSASGGHPSLGTGRFQIARPEREMRSPFHRPNFRDTPADLP